MQFPKSIGAFIAIRAIALLASAQAAVIAGAANTPVFSRAPYLQLPTTNSIHVVWRTAGPITPIVRFGTNAARLTDVTTGENIVVRASLGTNGQTISERWKSLRTEENLKLPKLHSAPVGTFQYEAKLGGLKTSTRYYYAVFDGERRLTPLEETYTFETPPPVGARQPIRIWAIGDAGTRRQAQADVYKAMREYTEKDHRPIDLWIYAGDIAYTSGRDMEFQSRFFEVYEPTLRNIVCWPSMGNHEGTISKGTAGIGPYYDAYVLPKRGEAGGVASGTEVYYSYDYGNIHFICVASYEVDRKPGGAMAKWLKADLEKTRADWIIAYWHHPPYTKGSHDSDKEKDLADIRLNLMPILESGGVDLVICGHSHTYERSMLVDGAYANPTVAENVVLDDGDGDPKGDGPYRKSEGIHPHQGAVYVVCGNAGQNLGRNGTVPFMRSTLAEYGAEIVDVDGDTLVASMISRTGKVLDRFSIVKKGKVEPARIALPWQPPEFKKDTNAVRTVATPPLDHKVVIPRNADWRYLAGQHPRGLGWTTLGFDDSAWTVGSPGIGFGEFSLQTELKPVERKPASVYLRAEFKIEQADKVTELGLMINYHDAFIAYLNGREVARSGVGRSSGRNAQKLKAREDRGFSYFALKDVGKNLKDGANVLAIETHAVKPDSLDLLVDPYLLLED